MAQKTVKVALTATDLHFLADSIGLNIPDDREKTADELRTTEKIRRAQQRLRQQETR